MQKLLTQRDVAKMLGISSDRIREYTRAGLLDHVSLPGLNKPRYTVECVERFIERRTTHCHVKENYPPISGGNLERQTSSISSI